MTQLKNSNPISSPIIDLLAPLSSKEKVAIIEDILDRYGACFEEVIEISDEQKNEKGNDHHQTKNSCCGSSSCKENGHPHQSQALSLNMEDPTLIDIVKDQNEDEWIDYVAKKIKYHQQERIDALAPNEKIVIPSWSPAFQDYNDENTLHLDSFLYTPDDVDMLIEENILPTHRCLDCQSTQIQELNFISHSMDRIQLKFLFRSMFKDYDFSNRVILDVGSRLGAVIYSAYAYTNCPDIRGIEINPHFVDLTNKVIKTSLRSTSTRVQCIQGDILSQRGKDLIQEADVLIFNNVFQFFVNGQQSKLNLIWSELLDRLSFKPNQIVITVPSLEEQLEEAGISHQYLDQVKSKFELIPLDESCFDNLDLSEDHVELCSRIFMYRVIV